MAQLRRGFPEIRAHDGEVVQITHNTVDEARRYAKFYTFDFAYLCDPDRTVHDRYGLSLEWMSPLGPIQSLIASAADRLRTGEITPSPAPFVLRHPAKDAPQAVFVIDRQGIVRAVHRASPNADIPPASTLVKDLARID